MTISQKREPKKGNQRQRVRKQERIDKNSIRSIQEAQYQRVSDRKKHENGGENII